MINHTVNDLKTTKCDNASTPPLQIIYNGYFGNNISSMACYDTICYIRELRLSNGFP